MDKKLHFQKNLLLSSIKELNNKVDKLQCRYNDLNTKKNSICNIYSDLTTINNTILKLETQKLHYKKTIHNLTTTISEIKNKLKEYPDIIIENIKKENNILNDELERINSERLEIINNHNEEIQKAYIDKEELLNNINLSKEKSKCHNDYINTIQIDLHHSRKNIIEQLKDNKIKKNNINNEIKNHNENINNFKDKLNQLTQNNNELEKFKKIIIDCDYKLEYNTINLEEYYNKFNIDKELFINIKLNLIDTIINNNVNDINYINKKMNKTEINNNNNISDYKKNNTNTNNSKVMTYKDTYKMAKEKKKELQVELDTLIEHYNNYEIVVINIINTKFQTKIKELDLDSIRANDRFKIIKLRLKNEEEKNKIGVEENINTIKIELLNNETNIVKVSHEIKELIKNKNTFQSITLEINKLELEIKNYKNSIINYEKDLLSLN